MEILVQNQHPKTPLPWEWADAAARRLLSACPDLAPNTEVSVVIVDDAAIHALNQQWRGKDKPTDVLSWPQSEPGEPRDAYLGDVVISRDTAARQAAARGWTLSDELALLLVHGILHLLGHEDDTEAGAEAMKVIEREILGKPLDPLP